MAQHRDFVAQPTVRIGERAWQTVRGDESVEIRHESAVALRDDRFEPVANRKIIFQQVVQLLRGYFNEDVARLMQGSDNLFTENFVYAVLVLQRIKDNRESPDEQAQENARYIVILQHIVEKLCQEQNHCELVEQVDGNTAVIIEFPAMPDRDALMANLDELKKMLPVQLERASALMREAERRLESAQTQANAIVASAQSRAADTIKEANDQAQFLAGQENVTELARQKARTILNTAQAKADHLTQGADDYSAKVMEGLRQQLTKLTSDVDAGLNVLHERQRAAADQLPHLDQNDYPEA